MHPYSHLAVHEERGPFIVTRGGGIYVYDEGGQPLHGGPVGPVGAPAWGSASGASSTPRSGQMETLPFGHSFSHRASVPVIELAEKLIGMAPDPMAKAYFVNSGSEAVDTAVKMVWYYNNALDRPDKRRSFHAGAPITG